MSPCCAPPASPARVSIAISAPRARRRSIRRRWSELLYNAISCAERRQLHDSIGGWIEAHPREEDVSALLARHFLHAQRNDKAIRYLIAAGELAIRRYANTEAADLLTRAHELAEADAGAAPTP